MTRHRKIIAGNWKMYKTIEEATRYFDELRTLTTENAYFAVPFTAINAVRDVPFVIGAQNMHFEEEGAFTGEISAKMLLDVGAKFVILGHSERRHIFGETNEMINKKMKMALKSGIEPILCVGETLEEREAGKTEAVLKKQITECLEGISSKNFILAYEPVWAIGTGVTATPEQAESAHAYCRKFIDVPILYGGSVKPENVKELMEKNHIDGVLVGGASLKPKEFSQIINYQVNL